MHRNTIAVKDIAPGDEITIYYGKAEGTRVQRQWNLERRYRFKCTCITCSLTGSELEASDARRVEIERLIRILEKNKTVGGLHPGAGRETGPVADPFVHRGGATGHLHWRPIYPGGQHCSLPLRPRSWFDLSQACE